MLKNYVLTAIRSLKRHRFFSFINVFGLAMAMSICMAMIMLVGDQVSYDRYNTNAGRIYRVTTISVDDNGNVTDRQWNAAGCLPLAPELMASHTGVEDAVRLRRGFGNGWMVIENQDINIPLAGFFADPQTLDFFQYELQYGDAATALKDPFTVVLTRKAADKLFDDENPVGKTIKVGELGLYTVTGVLKETHNKSHIVFEALASMASARSLEQSGKLNKSADDWHVFWDSWTYIRLEEGKKEADIQSRLDKIYEQYITTAKPGDNKMKFGLQPLLRITPGNIMNNSIGPQLPWEFVYFLGGLSLVILLTSCFNFTNLSIARSLTRAREIGVRKVAGAGRWQIFSQFITESVLVAGAALIMAMMLLEALKPMILQLNLAQLFRWDLYNGTTVYAIFVVFAAVVGIMAGFFPAVVLSGFQPVKVLKSLNNLKLFSRMGMRKALLVSQFTLSLFFIATVIIIYNQLNLFTHHEHGFNMKNNVMVRLNNTSYQNLKTELQKYNNITAVSAASHVPAAGTSWGTSIKRRMEDPTEINAGIFHVDEDYADNMQLKLLAGEFFKAEKGESNANFVVINATAAAKANFKRPQDAIGETIVFPSDTTSKIILGVVSDYNHRDLTREITPMLLLYKPASFAVMQVAYVGPYEKATESIRKAWATVNPGLKIDYSEVESEINQFYNIVFGDLTKVLAFVSFLAILISCLGLLGMATYATETRIKEISIRKVLGSSGRALVVLLSKGFMGMLLLSVLFGVPLVWFANNLWLEMIAYHTTVSPGVIAISVLLLMFFGAITVGSQTLRATLVKPVDNLKSE
ncbi:MAG TPA: ABC transporter permease [Cyclobacteriaceae bacterium]|nr:ABC transporter permease [Cyclobacteriaceae bacterium]